MGIILWKDPLSLLNLLNSSANISAKMSSGKLLTEETQSKLYVNHCYSYLSSIKKLQIFSDKIYIKAKLKLS